MARDFFDELSDTITRTTKDLGKKAGQLYESQKIRSKISSEEQMVQKLSIWILLTDIRMQQRR